MNRDQAIEAVLRVLEDPDRAGFDTYRAEAEAVVDAIWPPQPEATPYSHGLIQTIRGMCTDEVPYSEIDQALVRLDEMMRSPQPDRERPAQRHLGDATLVLSNRSEDKGTCLEFGHYPGCTCAIPKPVREIERLRRCLEASKDEVARLRALLAPQPVLVTDEMTNAAAKSLNAAAKRSPARWREMRLIAQRALEAASSRKPEQKPPTVSSGGEGLSSREPDDERMLYAAWACLVDADSILSLIVHRYGSRLPDDVRRDADATYVDCRKMADRIKATDPLALRVHFDELRPSGLPQDGAN